MVIVSKSKTAGKPPSPIEKALGMSLATKQDLTPQSTAPPPFIPRGGGGGGGGDSTTAQAQTLAPVEQTFTPLPAQAPQTQLPTQTQLMQKSLVQNKGLQQAFNRVEQGKKLTDVDLFNLQKAAQSSGYGRGSLGDIERFVNDVYTPKEEQSFTPLPEEDKQEEIKVGFQQVQTPERGTISSLPRQEFQEDFEDYEFPSPIEFARMGVETAGRFAGEGAEFLAKKAGVPTIITETEIPERRFTERTTSAFQDRVFYLPESQTLKEAPKAISFFGPTTIGQTAQTISTLGLYAVPQVGIPLVAKQTGESFQTYKGIKIPTIEEYIKEQTINLPPEQRQALLENEQYRKDVAVYINSLKKEKQRALTAGITGTAILSTPILYGAGKGIFVKRVVAVKVPKPKPLISEVSVLEIESDVSRAIGVKVGGTYTPPTIQYNQRGYEKWLGIKPKASVLVPARKDVLTEAFLITGDEAVSFGVGRKVGSSIQKFSQTAQVAKPTSIVDLSKLPPLERWVSGKLPIQGLSPDVVSFTGVSRRFEGFPTATKGIRKMRESKYSTNYFLPTKPMQTTYGISYGRILPLTQRGQTSFFVGEQATKTTKSLFPRRTGKVSVEKSIIRVGRLEMPDIDGVTIIASGKKSLKRQQELAQKALSVTSNFQKVPKPKIPKAVRQALEKTETFPYYPKAVGGLGKAKSQFFGRGVYERTDEIISVPTREFMTLETKPSERIKFTDLSKSNVRQGISLRIGQKERTRERNVFAPVIKDDISLRNPVREAIREEQVVIPRVRQSLKFKQIQRQRIKIPQTPRIPLIPKIPKIPPPNLITKTRTVLEGVGKGRTGKDSFTPFVKRYGRFQQVGKPTTFEFAKARGESVLRRTLGATLQIRKGQKPIPFARETKEFRLGESGRNPFLLVQRARQRLGRREEVMEIISRRSQNVKFF